MSLYVIPVCMYDFFLCLVIEGSGRESLRYVQSDSLTQGGALKTDKGIKFRYLLGSDPNSPKDQN